MALNKWEYFDYRGKQYRTMEYQDTPIYDKETKIEILNKGNWETFKAGDLKKIFVLIMGKELKSTHKPESRVLGKHFRK